MSVKIAGYIDITGQVVFTQGQAPEQAQASGTASGGVITNVTIDDPGSGYCNFTPDVLVVSPAYSNAILGVVVDGNCQIVDIPIIDGGTNNGTGPIQIVIDPPTGKWWTTGPKFEAGYIADHDDGGRLGSSTAVSEDGSTFASGAYFGETTGGDPQMGFVAVYVTDGIHEWAVQTIIDSVETVNETNFGHSVALSNDGNTLAVGAPAYIDQQHAGMVHVYTRSGETWTLQQSIANPTPSGTNNFGFSVDLSGDGDTLIVGDPDANAPPEATGAGRIWSFSRSGNTWTDEDFAYGHGVEVGAGDRFGYDVAISNDGNYVIAGAPDRPFIDDQEVSIFTYNNGFTFQTSFTDGGTTQSDEFGTSVDINENGSIMVVGAPNAQSSIAGEQGRAYVYSRTGSVWVLSATLESTNADTQDFGWDVSINGPGDLIVVSDQRSDPQAVTNAGNTYMFELINLTWTQIYQFDSPDPGSFYQFGVSISLSKDSRTLIVGENGAGNTDAGRVWAFTLDDLIPAVSKLTALDANLEDQFGHVVSVNGTGDEVAIGAPDADGRDGAVYVFETQSPWSQAQKLTPATAGNSYYFGTDVAMSTDGTTLIVGEPTDGSLNGEVHVFEKDPGPDWSVQTSLSSTYVIQNTEVGDFGSSVDISGDGSVIAVAGTTNHAEVFYGTNWTSTYKFDGVDDVPDEGVAAKRVAISDDGDWLAVSWPDNIDPGTDSYGVVGIFKRSGNAWLRDLGGNSFIENPVQDEDQGLTNRRFGSAIDIAVNNGSPVAFIGNPGWPDGANFGQVHVATSPQANNEWSIVSSFFAPAAGGRFGSSIALSPDGVVAVIGERNGDNDKGLLHIYMQQSATDWAYIETLTAPDGASNDALGQAVTVSSDYSVAIGGAPFASLTGAGDEEGAAYAFNITLPNVAQADATVANGKVTSVTVTDGASGYTYPPLVTDSQDNSAVYQAVLTGDTVTSINVLYSGGYENVGTGSYTSAVNIIVEPTPGSRDGRAFAGASITQANGALDTVYIIDGGSGYAYPPIISFVGEWDIEPEATAVLTGDTVTSITIDEEGDELYIPVSMSLSAPPGLPPGSANVPVLADIYASYQGFGMDIKLSEDESYLIVGGPAGFGGEAGNDEDGKVQVFSVPGLITDNTPDEIATFTDTTNPLVAKNFGRSVDATSTAQHIVVGSEGSSTTNYLAGAVTVISSSGFQTWADNPPAKLVEGASYDNLGYDVAISPDGEVIIAGAPGDTGEASSAGHASVLHNRGVNTNWSGTDTLSRTSGVTGDYFGESVASSGDGSVLVVGGPGSASTGFGAGLVTVFEETAFESGTWSQVAVIDYAGTGPEGLYGFGRFGSSVAVSDDGGTVVVGMPDADNPNGDYSAGGVAVYTGSGATWSLQQVLVPPSIDSYGYLGTSVSISPDANTIVMGGEGYSYYSVPGRAHRFTWSGTAWEYQEELTPDAQESQNEMLFGTSASVTDGEMSAVGAPGYNRDEENEGKAWVFYPDNWTPPGP